MHVTLVEWVCSCTMCTWSIQIFDDELFIFLPGPFFLPLRDFCFLYMQWGKKSHFLFYYCNNWLNKIDEKVLRKSVISRLLYSTSTFCIWLALDFLFIASLLDDRKMTCDVTILRREKATTEGENERGNCGQLHVLFQVQTVSDLSDHIHYWY